MAWSVNAEAAADGGAGSPQPLTCHFIHISTDYVFDGTAKAGEYETFRTHAIP